MNSQDLICTITVLFIVGMIWLRTRMQYSRQTRGVLQLQRAGQIYFGSVIVMLLLGWLVAPVVGRAMWPDTNVTPGWMRVVWFLVTYYVFILAHRVLKTRGVAVFKVAQEPV
jgi:hypothetical protein